MNSHMSPTRFLGTFGNALEHGLAPAAGWLFARAELFRRRGARHLRLRMHTTRRGARDVSRSLAEPTLVK
jgi:hypothetical protein